MRLRALAVASTMAVAATASLLAASPAEAMPLVYVGLGDSYSSGVGAGDYLADTPECLRSPYAYPSQASSALAEAFWFEACSGAKTSDVAAEQLGHLSGNVEHVTISVGGNDIGFSKVLGACAGTDTALCAGAVDNAKAQIRDVLPGLLDGLYDQIEAKAPNALTVVVGNPRLFNGTTCAGSVGITPDEQALLNEAADLLDETTRTVATAHGFGFADPREVFTGHEVCSADPYLLGYQPAAPVESFHPNRAGQDAYTRLVLAHL